MLRSTAFHNCSGLTDVCRARVSVNTTSPAHSGSLGRFAAVPVFQVVSTSPRAMRASARETERL